MKPLKNYLTFSFILFYFFNGNAQLPNFEWVKSNGNSPDCDAKAVAVDNQGNVYTFGEFRKTVDLHPDSSSLIVHSEGYSDLFIQKLDKNGNFQWIKTIGNGFKNYSHEIRVNSQGDVFALLTYEDTLDCDPGPNEFNIISKWGEDQALLKLDSLGNLIWAKSFGGDGMDEEFAGNFTFDASDNILITGTFLGTMYFNISGGQDSIQSHNFYEDAYILKLNQNGEIIWAKAYGGGNRTHAVDIEVDFEGNIITLGKFNYQADFNPGIDTNSLLLGPGWHVYIQKLNSAGNFIWVKGLRTDWGDDIFPRQLELDSKGAIYFCGEFEGNVDFDPGLDSVFTNNNISGKDMFIEKLNHEGLFQWVKTYGIEIFAERSFGLKIDKDDFIYYTGSLVGTIDFSTDSSTTLVLSPWAASTDGFILKLDSLSHVIWGSNLRAVHHSIIERIDIDVEGNIVMVGYFSGICDFDIGLGNLYLDASGAFTLKLRQYSGVGEPKFLTTQKIDVFPNPFTKKFKIRFAHDHESNINIYDPIGRLVMSQKGIVEKEFFVDLNGPKGIYLVMVEQGAEVFVTKVLKE